AGVADEDGQRDDDRDVDERRDDVGLRRGRHERAEEGHRDDEHDRRDQLEHGPDASHTRSTACCPARVNSPPGRISSTRMTAANRNDGRYWLWFVCRAPPTKPPTTPLPNPPITPH